MLDLVNNTSTGPFAVKSSAAAVDRAPREERQPVVPSGKDLPQQSPVVDVKAQVAKAAEVITSLVQQLNRDLDLQFHVDDSSGVSIVTVLDAETGDVIRQLPSEESLAVARYIAEFSQLPTVGFLMDSME